MLSIKSVEQLVEAFGKVVQFVSDIVLQALDGLFLFIALFVEKHISRRTQVVVEFYPHIPATMLRECDVPVGVDVLGVVQTQLHHRRNHVFQPVRADEGARFRHLLNG